MNKKLKWILIACAFFALSRGLWYDFQSLWLQDNGLSIKTISTVTSLAALASVSAMLLFFDHITKDRLKTFINILLIAKILILIALFLLNNSNLYLPIKILILADVMVDTEVLVSIYPLLALFQKNDNIYCVKDLIICSFHDIGILIGSVFLGRKLLHFDMTFNTFLFLSIICTIISFIIITKIDVTELKTKEKQKGSISIEILNKIKKDKISIYYLLYTLVTLISFSMVAGLKMLLLTNVILYTPNSAATYLLVISIISDVIGILVLKWFTAKNNNINIFIKIGLRSITCFIAFLINSNIGFMLALSYCLLLSNSYSNVLDAPYINRYDNEYQLAFSNIRNIVSYTAQSIGILICGLLLITGTRYLFLIAAILMLIQAILAMKANSLRLKEDKNK